MPYIRIETNVNVADEKSVAVLAAVVGAAATATEKPIKVFQGCLSSGLCMSMSGSHEPTAYVEFKTLGLGDKASALSAGMCAALKSELNIPGDRVYISFQLFDKSMWGKDGKTME